LYSKYMSITKTYFPPEPKTDTTYSTTGKKVPPARVQQVYLLVGQTLGSL
jgi:hypothetical protein